MLRIYTITLIILLSSCQKLNNNTNYLDNDSSEVITDPIPFTDVPADTLPAEGKVSVLSRISLNGQNLGLTTAANLGVNIGEAGRVSVSQANSNQWHTINLLESYESPVVIMQPLSYNAGDPAVVRIKDVASNSFQFKIAEWNYLNGSHGIEEISYLVLEEGIWSLKNGLSFEAGKTAANHNFKQVNLQLNFTNPVILTQSQTYNGADPITTRQQLNGSGFQVKVQEEEGGNGIHGNETVGYIAVSQGQERLGNVAIVAGIKGNVTQNFKTINFGFSVPLKSEKPVFLAGIQSYNEADTAALRYKNLGVSTVKVRVEEEASADAETLHAAESVGYLSLANIPSLSLKWSKQFGTSNNDYARGAAVENSVDASLLVVGSTSGSLEGSSAGGLDAFVRKYSSSGDVLWTRQFGTSGSDTAVAVAVDNSKNVFVTGYTNGNLKGRNAGLWDSFLRKYDSSGNVVWTKQFGSSGSDFARGIAVDVFGNVVVVGYTTGDLAGSNAGLTDVFVNRYNNDGNKVWAKQFGTSGLDEAYAVSIRQDYTHNDIFVAGITSNNLAGTHAGKNDVFLRRYSTVGNELQIRQFGTSDNDYVKAIKVEPIIGRIEIAGYTKGNLAGGAAGFDDAFVRKYDTSFNSLRTEQFGTSNYDRATAITTFNPSNTNNKEYRVIVAGFTRGNLFSHNAGKYDAFIREYDDNGNELWKEQFGTTSNDRAIAIATDPQGNVFLVGYTKGQLTRGSSSAGGEDVFVRKYIRP